MTFLTASLLTPSTVTTYLFICLLALGGMLVVAASAWRARATRAGQVALAALGCVCGWLLAVILALLSPTPALALFWHETVRLVFVALITPLVVLYIACYFGVPRPSRRLVVGLFAIPTLTILFDLTNPLHYWFLASYAMQRVGPYFVRAAWVPGPWFPIYALFTAGSMLVAVGAVLLAYRRRAPLYRAQAGVFTLSLLLPAALLTFDTVSRAPLALLSLAPLGFAATALLQIWLLGHYRFLDLVPVAREAMFAGMDDPVIALDAHGRVVDLNPAAEEVMDGAAGAAVAWLGAPIEALLARRLSDLQAIASEERPASVPSTLDLDRDGELRCYDVRVSPFGLRPRSVDGHLVVLRDVTELKRTQARLAAQISQLEATFETITDGVVLFDRDGHLLRANRTWESMFRIHATNAGLSADPEFAALSLADQVARLPQFQPLEARGRPIPLDQIPTLRALRGEVITGERAVDEWTESPNGQRRQGRVSAAPVRDGAGQVMGAVAVVRDVTEHCQLERQVKEQASELEAIVFAMSDGVAVYDREGRLVRANPALAQLFGIVAQPEYATLSLSERTQRLHIYDEAGQLLAMEQWPHWRVLRGEVLAGPTVTQTRVQTLDGREIWVETSGAPIRGADGQITGGVLMSRDVTARRALAQQVQQQANQLEAVFAAITDGIFVLDAEGRPLRLNPAARALFGRAQSAEIPPTAEERAHGVELRDAAGQPLSAAQWPTTRLLRGEVFAEDTALTLRLRSHDGHERIVSLTGGPLRDAHGHLMGVVGVFRDVTRAQQMQQALAEQERQFRTLAKHSPDIIARFDRELRYLYVSPAIAQVSPVPVEAYRGKTNAELGVPEAVSGPAHRAIEQVFQTGTPQTLEESDAIIRNPETARYFRAQILPEFAADGSVESVLTVTAEITELKRTERALRLTNAAAEAARQAEERRTHIAESLREVLAALNSSRPLRDVLQHIVRQVHELLSSAAAVVYGLDDFGEGTANGAPAETLRTQAAAGPQIDGHHLSAQQRLPFADAAVQHALTSAQPVALLDVAGGPSTGSAGEVGGEASAEVDGSAAIPVLYGTLPTPYQAVLVIPIRIQNGSYGCLLLCYSQPHHFAAEEVALAQAYVDHVALAITNARLQAHIERAAAAAERTRLAHDVHDTIAQVIFSANLLAESVERNWDGHRAEAETALQQLPVLTRSALAGLRVLLLELRPTLLDEMPLSTLLRQLGEAISARAGVPIDVQLTSSAARIESAQRPLPPAVKAAFYRVAQEALTNAAKHAQARAICVRLRTRGQGKIEMEIFDDGRGFDASTVPAGRVGLAMMRERAQAVGATMEVRSPGGQGTRVIMGYHGVAERPAGRRDSLC
jgi:PAS domain S-box-containing protein